MPSVLERKVPAATMTLLYLMVDRVQGRLLEAEADYIKRPRD
jgi:hypothetical protein